MGYDVPACVEDGALWEKCSAAVVVAVAFDSWVVLQIALIRGALGEALSPNYLQLLGCPARLWSQNRVFWGLALLNMLQLLGCSSRLGS